LGDTSSGFLCENREAVIISLALNYESENPKDLFGESRIKIFLKGLDGNQFFKNNELTDFGKKLVQTINNSQIRLKRNK